MIDATLRDPPLAIDVLIALYPRKKQHFCDLILKGKPMSEQVHTPLGSISNYRLPVVVCREDA